MKRFEWTLVTVAAVLALAAPAHAALRVGSKAAVPGQVVVLSGKGVAAKGAVVTIGGKRARVIQRRAGRLYVVVPKLKPGIKRVVVRKGRHRFKGRLRVKRVPATGALRPEPEPLLAASAMIGREGGSVTARGSDGTEFELFLPPGAVADATLITLTPIRRIGNFPLPGADPVAVQFAPDGLVLAVPATLRITLTENASSRALGFAFDGTGHAFELLPVERSGRTLSFTVEHFSSAGTGNVTATGLIVLLGQLATKLLSGTLTAADVNSFTAAWRAFFLEDPTQCTADPTCNFVFGGVRDYLVAQSRLFECRDLRGVVAGRFPSGSDAIRELERALEYDAELRLLGLDKQAADLETARRCLTVSLLLEARSPAESAPLEASTIPTDPRDVTNADRDGNGKATTCEWAVSVGRIAALQGFSDLQGDAVRSCETGLRKVLEEGKSQCDTDFRKGHKTLEDGFEVARAAGPLVTEFTAALDNCVPRVVVTPADPSVEVSKTATFSARSNDPDDTAFTWTASAGSIGSTTGDFTAPDVPGPVTVTATSAAHGDHTGSTTVNVTCPAGKVAFQGECKEIGVSISPTSATLMPGGTQQFTATVSNTLDTRVDWFANGGSITQNGFYTAPQAPGGYTITAVSRADPSKSATASVQVGVPKVEVSGREAFVSVSGDFRQRDPNLPFAGVWNETASSSSGTAHQESDLEPAGNGQDWMKFDGSGAGANGGGSVSRQVVTINVQTVPATLSCSGSSSAPEGAIAQVSLDPGTQQQQVLVNHNGDGGGAIGFNVTFQEAASHDLFMQVGASTSGSMSLTCDFDGPVVVAVND